jgi:hypothetical protein
MSEKGTESDFRAEVQFEFDTPPVPGDQWSPLESTRFQVLDAGRDVVLVPFLTCRAGPVEGLTASAKRATSAGVGGEFSFKLAGNGLGATAKVTITTSDQLSCASGQMKTAYVHVPVLWEQRAPEDNDDISWLHLELDPDGTIGREITVRSDTPPTSVISTVKVTNESGAGTYDLAQEHTIEAGMSFTVGFSNDLLDASLKIFSETSDTVSLTASLPAGVFKVSWVGGPAGAAIEKLTT